MWADSEGRKRRAGEAGHKGGSDYNTDIERMFAPDRQDGTQDRGLYVTRRETEARRTENEVAEAKKSVRRQMRALGQGVR